MQDIQTNPFDGPIPQEIHLSRSPLISVIGLIRIPSLATLSGKGFDDFAEKMTRDLQDEYPLLQREVMSSFSQQIIAQNSAADIPMIPIIKLRSSDQNWRLTITPTSLGIEVQKYTSRTDFISRYSTAINTFNLHSGAPFIERLGIRYINRIQDSDHLNHLGDLIQDPILAGISIPRIEEVNLIQMFSTCLFEIGENSLQGNWGILGPDVTPDVSIKPLGETSWVLDLDAFTDQISIEMDISERISELSQMVYRFFRWSIKDHFITTFGGE